jgi:hypothetical protein
MNPQEVTAGSCWRYIGPPPGQDMVHRVVNRWHQEPGSDPLVVTWSHGTMNCGSGMTWLGPESAFKQHFVKTAAQP